MIGYGKFISFMRSGNLLSASSFCQNVSKNGLKSMKGTILPPKPKKPESSFFLYIKHIKQKLIQENPSLKHVEIIKIASKEWAELDFIEKDNFKKQYNQNYQVYVEKLKEYNDSLTDEEKQLFKQETDKIIQSKEEAIIKRKRKVLGKPKRPLNAFLSYIASKKSERDLDSSFMDWMKSITASWNKLSESEKEPYVTQAAQRMEEYRKDTAEWEKKMMDLGHNDIVRSKTLVNYKHVRDEQ